VISRTTDANVDQRTPIHTISLEYNSLKILKPIILAFAVLSGLTFVMLFAASLLVALPLVTYLANNVAGSSETFRV